MKTLIFTYKSEKQKYVFAQTEPGFDSLFIKCRIRFEHVIDRMIQFNYRMLVTRSPIAVIT